MPSRWSERRSLCCEDATLCRTRSIVRPSSRRGGGRLKPSRRKSLNFAPGLITAVAASEPPTVVWTPTDGVVDLARPPRGPRRVGTCASMPMFVDGHFSSPGQTKPRSMRRDWAPSPPPLNPPCLYVHHAHLCSTRYKQFEATDPKGSCPPEGAAQSGRGKAVKPSRESAALL